MPKITLNGKLEAYWETGTEGVYWAFVENGREGYENLHILQNGDKLTVFADAARAVTKWQGDISLEYKRNWEKFPKNPEYGQQAVCGYWVHGLQSTLPPETWALMFFKADPAQLIFSAKEKTSVFSGHLEKFMIPYMQAPSWQLKVGGHHDTGLHNGDRLTVFEDEAKSKILWNGVLEFDDIDIRTRYVFPPKGQVTTAEDIRAHIFPKNVPPELWEKMIEQKRPADLIRLYWQRIPART